MPSPRARPILVLPLIVPGLWGVHADMTQHQPMGDPIPCDVLVVGGSLGGCAAALAAARLGSRVCLTEECAWIGGQITAQGVSALDEHRHIEQFGGTASYYELRETIRAMALARYRFREDLRHGRELNPGNGWVSRLCFEPRLGLAALREMMEPEVRAGRLRIFTGVRPAEVAVHGDRVTAVVVEAEGGGSLRFAPRMAIDATDLGDLLPMAGAEHVVGTEARSETDEPHARSGKANPRCQQSFTYTFAVEYRPGEDHTIPRPDGYETFRDRQPFTFDVDYGGSTGRLTYGMFARTPRTPGSFWTYRRLLDASQLDDPGFPNDIAMINWSGNDYRFLPAVGDDREAAFEEARRLSLCFLHWLQTEAPRDEGGRGYPELLLRADVMGTGHGLSQFPYIRESRRIRALRTVVEQDIAASHQAGARARFFDDSVGIGFYPIDIHGCGEEETGAGGPTRPFQIPMGALVPLRLRNLIAGCKNIGTTHLSNGAYRLHPVEWNIGESAGALAHRSLDRNRDPADLWSDEEERRTFQDLLIDRGVPLSWFVDVPIGHPAFAALQRMAARGAVAGWADRLTFDGNQAVDAGTASQWAARIAGAPGTPILPSEAPLLRRDASALLAAVCRATGRPDRVPPLLRAADTTPEAPVSRFEMLLWIDHAVGGRFAEERAMADPAEFAAQRAIATDGVPLAHDFARMTPLLRRRWNAVPPTHIDTARDEGGASVLRVRGPGPRIVEGSFHRDVSGYDDLTVAAGGAGAAELRLAITDAAAVVWTAQAPPADADGTFRVPFAGFRRRGPKDRAADGRPWTIETLRLEWIVKNETDLLLRRVGPGGSRGWRGPAVSIAENPPAYARQDWRMTARDVRDQGFTAAHFVVIGGVSPLHRQRTAVDAFHGEELLCAMRLFPTTDIEAYARHPEWRQRMLGGGSRHDWRVYLCPNHPEFVEHTVDRVRTWLRAVPYDGIELSEPWFEVWGGPYAANPQRDKYACLCDRCVARFRELTGEDPRALFDPDSPAYFERPGNRALYERWTAFRVDTVLRFSGAILDAAREERPGIFTATMHLSDIRQEPDRVLEYQAQDLDASVRRLRPDMLTIQDAWQDWTRPALSPDFVEDYGRAYVGRVRAIRPGIILKAHADLGSLPEMRRSHLWIRRFSTAAHEAGFDAPIYYEYTLADWGAETPADRPGQPEMEAPGS